MKARSKLLWHYALWAAASFVVLVAPLVTVLIVKRGVYFAMVTDVWKISIGGGICAILLLLLILGKLKAPGGVVTLAVVCLISWLLDAILDDLFLLSLCALLGKVVDWIVFAPRLRRLRRLLDMNEQATVTAMAVAAAVKPVERTGRV